MTYRLTVEMTDQSTRTFRGSRKELEALRLELIRRGAAKIVMKLSTGTVLVDGSSVWRIGEVVPG